MHNYVDTYLAQQKETMSSLPAEQIAAIISLFQKAMNEGRQIFVFGNGGSGNNASHFVTDLGKGSSDKTHKRFRCICLNDNIGWITALGNDYAFEDVFLRQLMNHAQPGDILFVMSVSGNSPNIVKAMEWAVKNDLHCIALVGNRRGRLAELAHDALMINDDHYGRVEDAHMTICHIITYAFMELETLQKP